jgi:S-(hydroxymethyl)glutathione dehydrogenase/alcohol dehydrogenase
MLAAVLHQRREPLVIEEVELDPPGPGEAQVRLMASGVCHSDYSHWRRDTWTPLPLILGHEGSGIVTAVGPDVSQVKPGDHIILAFGNKCGTCAFCRRGEPYLCTPQDASRNVHFRTHIHRDGQPVYQFQGVGSFAQETTVPANNAIPIANDIPLEPASLIACGVSTGIGAVVNVARVEAGASVGVSGAGGVGLNVLQGARLAGATRIIAVDLAPQKLELARQFGATHVMRADEGDVAQRVAQLTGGFGADYAFEVIGLPQTIRQAYDATRKGGTMLVVGVAADDAQVTFSAADLMRSGKTIKGCVAGSAQPYVDFPRLVDLWQAGRILVPELISRRFALDEVNAAFAAMAAGEVARGVIVYE